MPKFETTRERGMMPRDRLCAAAIGVFVVGALSALSVGCVERSPGKGKRHGPRKLTPADHAIIRKNILKKPPARMSHPINAALKDKAVYLGADIKGVVKKGKPIRVIHYWKVLKAMPGWRLFTHLNGPGGKSSFINVDHVAIGGRYVVAKWKPGEIIRDEHTITVPHNWTHASIEIYTGIWQPGKGRLKVVRGASDGHDRVRVATLTVGARAGARGVARVAKSEKEYAVRQAKGRIRIDGKADEADWKEAPKTSVFVNSLKGTPGSVRTEAKMLWDKKNLYVLFECQDPDVWSNMKKHDGALWTQEAVELMIDADGDGATYIEIQVSPNGTTYDAYHPRKRQGQEAWESGMKTKVKVRGTLNKRKDKDEGWTVEIALPLRAVLGKSKAKLTLPPKPGDRWRANMFRMDFPKGKAREGLAWSPPRTTDFHTLERFGTLIFATSSGSVGKKTTGTETRPGSAPSKAGKATRPKGRAAGSRPSGARPAMTRPRSVSRRAARPARPARRIRISNGL